MAEDVGGGGGGGGSPVVQERERATPPTGQRVAESEVVAALRAQLAAVTVARDAAEVEAAGLRHLAEAAPGRANRPAARRAAKPARRAESAGASPPAAASAARVPSERRVTLQRMHGLRQTAGRLDLRVAPEDA